jgi:hypothetical protein
MGRTPLTEAGVPGGGTMWRGSRAKLLKKVSWRGEQEEKRISEELEQDGYKKRQEKTNLFQLLIDKFGMLRRDVLSQEVGSLEELRAGFAAVLGVVLSLNVRFRYTSHLAEGRADKTHQLC